MKRNLVVPLSEAAYKIFLTPSASPTEKAAQFAGLVAHQAASSNVPKKRADAFGRLAAKNMLNLVQKSCNYSATQAEKSAAVEQAKAEQIKAQIPWIHSPEQPSQLTQLESFEMTRSRAVNDDGYPIDSERVFKSRSLQQSQADLESSSNIYPKAFCVAFLAFDRAAKTSSQKEFEAIIKNELMKELAEPFSYTEFFLQILRSKEMSTIMGVALFLGLVLLALPSIEMAFLTEATTYAVGGSMTFLGGAYHLWQFFSPESKPSEKEADELLLPQSV
ncbi:MAG: hypothetical protein K0U37_06890 [Gammaproteobacteria bacterium]|nr:hypothetical protein [Gammaproteobacteria bacterium]